VEKKGRTIIVENGERKTREPSVLKGQQKGGLGKVKQIYIKEGDKKENQKRNLGETLSKNLWGVA